MCKPFGSCNQIQNIWMFTLEPLRPRFMRWRNLRLIVFVNSRNVYVSTAHTQYVIDSAGDKKDIMKNMNETANTPVYKNIYQINVLRKKFFFNPFFVQRNLHPPPFSTYAQLIIFTLRNFLIHHCWPPHSVRLLFF